MFIRFFILCLGIFSQAEVFAQVASSAILKGDFRFRTENIIEEQNANENAQRTRQRIRLRLGGEEKINETTDILVRLATGSSAISETGSTNQDLTDYYSKKGIFLDLAYFNWSPAGTVNIWGGKTPIPFYIVGGSDLIFDSDLTPEGLALKYKMELTSDSDAYLNFGLSTLNERYSASGGDNTDVGLIGGQLGYSYKADNFNVGIFTSTYNFSNIKGSIAPLAKGNTLVSNAYLYEYKVTSVGLEIGMKLKELPLTAFAEFISNSEVGEAKTGSIYGIKLGNLKEVGAWSLSIDQRELQKDSTVGILADSDSSGGGTDITSLRLVGAYQVAVKSNIAFIFFSGKKNVSSDIFSPNYQRAMLDFNYNF